MCKYVRFLHFLLVYIFPQQPLPPLPDCATFSTSFLIPHDSDCGARVNSTCIYWSFLEMKNPILTQTSWLSITFEKDLLVKSFLSHRQCLMTHTHDFHEMFFDSLKSSSWITKTPLMSEHETLESSVSLTTLQIHIYILQIMPLHYNLRLCDSTAFLYIIQWVYLHHRQFSPCYSLPHTSLLQGLEGFPTGSALPGPGVRDSPVQQCMCSSFTTWWGPKWVLLPRAVPEVCLACFLGKLVSHLAAGFFPSPPVGAGFSCWQPAPWSQSCSLFRDFVLVPPTTLYSPVSTSCVNSLAIGSPCYVCSFNCSYTSPHFLCSS